MCGIFGWDLNNLNLDPAQRAALASALTIGNDDRGGQGWGYAFFKKKDGGIKVRKGKDEIGFKTLALSKLNFFMAHTRYATQGKPKIKNCHPFEIDHIIGAHNGMLDDHEYWNATYRRKFSVDSQHLFANIARDKDFSEMCGYGTIEWINRHDGKCIYLCQMQGGVLAACQITDGEKVGTVWSSDKDHLNQALEISGLTKKAMIYQIDVGQVYRVYEGALWKTTQKYKFGERYDRSWKKGLTAGSSTLGPKVRSNSKVLNDAWVRGNELNFDQDHADTLCDQGMDGVDDDKLIQVEFDDGASIEAIYPRDLIPELTSYRSASSSLFTTESLDDFLARTNISDNEMDRRWVDLQEGINLDLSNDVPDEDYEVGNWKVIDHTT